MVPRVIKLQGVVQHYAWGGKNFLPELLNTSNKENKPFAEYWLGVHPSHSANWEKGSLLQLIESNPDELLGKFGSWQSLPFLLKILDVEKMLSIQLHPNIEEARKGFEKEEKEGIALNALNRNYKDRNHKPELMVALDTFYLLHGFKVEEAIIETIRSIPPFEALLPIFKKESYAGLFRYLMELNQEEVNKILEPVIERIQPLYKNGELLKTEPAFWAARAAIQFCEGGIYDRGIFWIYFMNIVRLEKGEGIYQGPGVPHAYLQGQNVELMANSDNVLRAGLTDKHIDIPELMKHLKAEATIPSIIAKEELEEQCYPTPASEFELCRNGISERVAIEAAGPEIWILTEGSVTLHTGEEILDLKRGDSVYVLPKTALELTSLQPSQLFRARIPQRAGIQ